MKILSSFKKYWSVSLITLAYLAIYNIPQLKQFNDEMIFKGDTLSFVSFCLSALTFVVFIIGLIIYKKKGKKNVIIYRLWCFLAVLVLLYLYKGLIHYIPYPMGMLNPFSLTILFVTFLFLIHKTKLLSLYVLLFFAVPISIIAIDKYHEMKFINYCEKTCKTKQPDLFYKRFELPERYFVHRYKNEEVNSKRFWDDKNKLIELINKPNLQNESIYWDITCSEINHELEQKILESGYKIYCDDGYERHYSNEVNTITYYERLVGKDTKHYFFICGKTKNRFFNFLNFESYKYHYEYPNNKFIKQGE